MKQIEILIRNLMPEKGSRELTKGDGGASIKEDHESQAARLKMCLQEVSILKSSPPDFQGKSANRRFSLSLISLYIGCMLHIAITVSPFCLDI